MGKKGLGKGGQDCCQVPSKCAWTESVIYVAVLSTGRMLCETRFIFLSFQVRWRINGRGVFLWRVSIVCSIWGPVDETSPTRRNWATNNLWCENHVLYAVQKQSLDSAWPCNIGGALPIQQSVLRLLLSPVPRPNNHLTTWALPATWTAPTDRTPHYSSSPPQSAPHASPGS